MLTQLYSVLSVVYNANYDAGGSETLYYSAFPFTDKYVKYILLEIYRQ